MQNLFKMVLFDNCQIKSHYLAIILGLFLIGEIIA